MNERIKKIRKTLDLTQQEFAAKLGLKQNTIATYEMGRTSASDTVINNICKTFNVNEDWLRTGAGKMFAERDVEAQLTDWVERALSGRNAQFKKRFAVMLMGLSDSEWDALREKAELLAGRQPDPEPKDEPTIEERVEAYRQHLLLQEEAEEKSAD